jgi:hypothetical protein
MYFNLIVVFRANARDYQIKSYRGHASAQTLATYSLLILLVNTVTFDSREFLLLKMFRWQGADEDQLALAYPA